MTLVAVWQFAPHRIHAIADTRISSGQSVLTDHGPKILPLTMVCRKPGPSGFFDTEAYRAEFGFAFSGSTLSALSTHALANILLGNLVGLPDAPPPFMDEVAAATGTVAYQYMSEIAQLGGPGSLFRAILFGHCPRTSQSLAFQFEPSTADGFLVNIEKHVLDETTVIMIGNKTELLKERIDSIRANAGHPIVAADAPIRALRSLISDGSIPSVGGAIQQAWAIPFRLEIAATMESIPARPPSSRNAGLFVLGFDTFDMQTVGSFKVSLSGRM